MKILTSIGIGILFIVLMTAMTTAQPEENSVLDTVQDAIATGELVMFTLNTPLPIGEQIITSSDMQIQIDADFVCFGEPWNDGTRQHCVPYNNIASITFLTD